MNPVSVDIMSILESDSSLGISSGFNAFIGREPVKPNNCITIFDTPGRTAATVAEKGSEYFYETAQIRIRNASYETGYSIAKTIADYLNGIAHITEDSTVYELITVNNGPFFLEYDDNENVKFIINLEIQRR